jgi:hypothetical protein
MELRFGEQQMDVLGHKDVAEDEELVADAESFEGIFEGGSGGIVVEVRTSTVTTEGDEVVVAFGLVTL